MTMRACMGIPRLIKTDHARVRINKLNSELYNYAEVEDKTCFNGRFYILSTILKYK